MSWRYAILKKNNVYHVCEYYSRDGGKQVGYTDAMKPMGESKQELLEELQMMVKDIAACIADDFCVEWKDIDE